MIKKSLTVIIPPKSPPTKKGKKGRGPGSVPPSPMAPFTFSQEEDDEEKDHDGARKVIADDEIRQKLRHLLEAMYFTPTERPEALWPWRVTAPVLATWDEWTLPKQLLLAPTAR